MECKCCGEEAEFTLIEEGWAKNRYQCSNCNKFFKADKEWLKNAKAAKKAWWLGGIFLTAGTALYHIATGNPEEAVATVLGLDGDDNNSTTA
jgi:hypothetical protein